MNPIERALVDADRWFGALPPARRTLLLDHAQIRAVPAGTRLYAVGDPPDGLWAVLAGQVRLMGYPADGVEQLALIVGPGTWFGELSTLDGGPRPHDAIAFGAARVLHVPMEAFGRAAAATPELYRDLGLLACAHQRATLAFLAQNTAQPIAVRLARTLAGAARAAGEGPLRIRQAEIAAMIGVSRQTLNKELRRLEDAGLVKLGYAEIAVLDIAALRAVA